MHLDVNFTVKENFLDINDFGYNRIGYNRE